MAGNHPGWRVILHDAIANSFAAQGPSANYYTLSTVDLGPPLTPKARIVVHRGFLNEARNHNGELSLAQDGFASNSVLLTTTDSRSNKAQALTDQIKRNGQAYAEICWWFKEGNIMFRMACTAQLLPHSSKASLFDGSSLVPPPLPVRNGEKAKAPEAFDWSAERARLFKKMPPGLVAALANPTGGIEHPHEKELFDAHEPGPGKDTPSHLEKIVHPYPSLQDASKPEEREFVHQANLNFNLVALAPYKVDVLDLVRAKRSAWELQGPRKGGHEETWVEHKLVP